MPMGEPKSLTECRRFFRQPGHPKQRQYEALRRYFLDRRRSREVAAEFGYSAGAFRVLCHRFRRDPEPEFFLTAPRGPQGQPKKSASRARIEQRRKRNHSVYEIAEALKARGTPLSATAVREVLREFGFAAPARAAATTNAPSPSVEPVADARALTLTRRGFPTRCGGLFLFLPDLLRLGLDRVATAVRLPGSKMIPAGHALRACLALKLCSIERRSQVMAVLADAGLGLFCGLDRIPKKRFLSAYSSRIAPAKTTALLAAWHAALSGPQALFPARSFDLDFHSVPDHGHDPPIERHYVAKRSRRQPGILVFLAQDAEAHAFCYSHADLRKGEAAQAVFGFLEFCKRAHGSRPAHLVFDSRLTTYAGLARLDALGITFITLRRRSPSILAEIDALPASAWRRTTLEVPTRKYRHPRVWETPGRPRLPPALRARPRRRQAHRAAHQRPAQPRPELLTRYAQRRRIENAISDAVRFFHMDALSAAVGLKVDFDMALLVIASGLYRRLAQHLRGDADSQARQIFRDLVDMPADIEITERQVLVRFHRRAHLPILIASGLLDPPVEVPWWNGAKLRLTA